MSSQSDTAKVMTTTWPSLKNGVAISWLVVAAAGLLEGAYGRTQYLGDAISYLNVSRAISAFDWAGIFDPMWNPGYPALIALARAIAPSTPDGEWYAITLLNWIIFLGAFAAWRNLIRTSIAFCMPGSESLYNHPVATWTTGCVFLGCNLGLDNVSSVYPDLLITTFFMLAGGQLLRLIERQTLSSATSLGAILGLGIWIKGVFAAFSGAFLLTLFLDCWVKRTRWSLLGIAVAVCGMIFGCYVAAISWSYGELTLGASGTLNYAWHVNQLPHWTNWQGGPPPFGMPIHPTRQILTGLPVFEFASPFRSTYPPYNNVAYWYQGFQQFFSPEHQLIAIGRGTWEAARIATHHPILICTAVGLLIGLLKPQWCQATCLTAKSLWPLGLPVLLGLGTYVAVGHVLDYYISAFVLIMALFSLAPLLHAKLAWRQSLATGLVLIYTLGAIAELALTDGNTIRAALHRADFHDDPQWRLAAALSGYGLKQGDSLALIRGDSFVVSSRVNWAYVSRLRIIAEFGALPVRLWPMDRTRFDSGAAEPAVSDYGQLFWTRLTAGQRAQVIDAFRVTGARAIVSLSNPKFAPPPGWLPLTGTGAWIYDLRQPRKPQ